jgi:hypothetical protein
MHNHQVYASCIMDYHVMHYGLLCKYSTDSTCTTRLRHVQEQKHIDNHPRFRTQFLLFYPISDDPASNQIKDAPRPPGKRHSEAVESSA